MRRRRRRHWASQLAAAAKFAAPRRRIPTPRSVERRDAPHRRTGATATTRPAVNYRRPNESRRRVIERRSSSNRRPQRTTTPPSHPSRPVLFTEFFYRVFFFFTELSFALSSPRIDSLIKCSGYRVFTEFFFTEFLPSFFYRVFFRSELTTNRFFDQV